MFDSPALEVGPLVLGGRGRGMEDEALGLLPIKETDMKYYVYVSTPIALVGSFYNQLL